MLNNFKFLLVFCFLIGNKFTFSQSSNALLLSASKMDFPKVKSQKSGPYIGFQKGKYDLIEFGAELQLKKITLTRPTTNAFRFGTNYDFRSSVLGFDAAYWRQQTRLGLTFGAIFSHRTNFDVSRIGFAPVIGFRLLQFHLQTGYTFYTKVTDFDEVNRFFIALKFTLINKRDIDVKK